MRAPSQQRARLLAPWHDARAETDALFGIVRPEFLFERPIAERHRIAFYIGHLEAFEWNLLAGRLGLASERPDLDALFALGIDPVAGDLPRDEPGDWPRLDQIHAYRDRVRARLDAALAHGRADEEEERELEQRLNVAIEHRQMHAETLAYLFHRLPFAYKACDTPVAQRPLREVAATTIDIPTGTALLGIASAAGTFGWDNEFEAHTVAVPAFSIDRFKVTNAQFMRFVAAGGYADPRWWTDADWRWRSTHVIEHPAFWTNAGDEWWWRSMFAAIPLPLDWPVYASHAEASAYARWAGRGLPTEAQWQRAAFAGNAPTPLLVGERDPRGRALRAVTRADAFDPLPVDADDAGPGCEFGLVGLHGNGWEWTSSPFAPFAGFHPFDFYPGYSQPFFDGRHYVLKGGSVRTASPMLRPSFRNWFQPHYPFVYAGFRCVDAPIASSQRSAS